MKSLLRFSLLSGLALLALPALAIDFDYEALPVASHAGSFSVTNLGLTCTASSSGGWLNITRHDVPTAMGLQYIIANSSPSAAIPTSPFSPLDFTFSQTITHATLLAGDTGGDNDGFVTVALYDNHNQFLTTVSSFLGTSPNAVSIDITTPFTRAVIDTTNTSFNPHSVGAEWHNVQSVPEPTTVVGMGLALLGFVRLRRSKK